MTIYSPINDEYWQKLNLIEQRLQSTKIEYAQKFISDETYTIKLFNIDSELKTLKKEYIEELEKWYYSDDCNCAIC